MTQYRLPNRVAIEVKAWVSGLALAFGGIAAGAVAISFIGLATSIKQNWVIFLLIFALVEWLFCYLIWVSYKTLRLTEPGLVIDRIGIDCNLPSQPWNRISWNEIKKVSKLIFCGKHLLILHLYDDRRIMNMGGPRWKLMRRLDKIVVGSPVSINTNVLDMPFDDVLAITQEYLAAAKGRGDPARNHQLAG